MIDKLLKLLKNLVPSQEERRKDFFSERGKTPSEKMQDELEPINNEDWWKRHKGFIDHRKKYPYYPDKNKVEEMDDPDYRAADHIDEIREIERTRTIGGNHGKEKS